MIPSSNAVRAVTGMLCEASFVFVVAEVVGLGRGAEVGETRNGFAGCSEA